MARTSLDVASRALEMLRVAHQGEAPEAKDAETAVTALVTYLSELDEIEQAALTWTAETVPEWAFEPISGVIAGRIAGSFGKEFASGGYEMRLRAGLFPDDRVGSVEAVYY